MNNANNIFEVGKIIRKRRIELGMTQEELAFKVGYKSRVSINKIELGRTVKLSLIKQFAEALHCSVDYLMGWEDLPDEDAEIRTEAKEIAEAIKLFKSLTPENRKFAIEFMKKLG